MGYDLYPAVDPSYNFPPEVRAALATSTELRNTVVPMTTTLRNNLTAGEKWDGRLILNTTTDRLERWDAGLAGWQQIADILDLAPYTAALLQRPGRNRLCNGNFAVNQRAFTSTTASGTFGFDRWTLGYTGGTVTYSAQAAALGDLPESNTAFARMATAGQSAAGDYAILAQNIEYVSTLSGKTATVSFWAKAASGTPKVAVEFYQHFGVGGSPSTAVTTYAGQVTLSTSWARYSLSAAVPSIAGKTLGTDLKHSLMVNLWTSAGTTLNARTGSLGIQNVTIDFWGVQAEEGSVATPFEVEEYGANLRRCQRFYWRQTQTIANEKSAGGVVANATTAYLWGRNPVPMRGNPAFSYSAVGDWVIYDGSGAYTSTGLVMTTGGIGSFGIDVTVASGLTSGRACFLQSPTLGAWIAFSAEL